MTTKKRALTAQCIGLLGILTGRLLGWVMCREWAVLSDSSATTTGKVGGGSRRRQVGPMAKGPEWLKNTGLGPIIGGCSASGSEVRSLAANGRLVEGKGLAKTEKA